MYTLKDKVYEVRESHKGGRSTYAMFFNKEKAVKLAAELNEEAKGCTPTFNYRVYEWTTIDSLFIEEN